MWDNKLKFDVLKGMVFTKIEGKIGDEEIVFHTSEGRQFKLYHSQD